MSGAGDRGRTGAVQLENDIGQGKPGDDEDKKV